MKSQKQHPSAQDSFPQQPSSPLPEQEQLQPTSSRTDSTFGKSDAGVQPQHTAMIQRMRHAQPKQAHRLVIQLQRQFGNRYVQRMMDSLQSPAETSSATSPHETQADIGQNTHRLSQAPPNHVQPFIGDLYEQGKAWVSEKVQGIGSTLKKLSAASTNKAAGQASVETNQDVAWELFKAANNISFDLRNLGLEPSDPLYERAQLVMAEATDRATAVKQNPDEPFSDNGPFSDMDAFIEDANRLHTELEERKREKVRSDFGFDKLERAIKRGIRAFARRLEELKPAMDEALYEAFNKGSDSQIKQIVDKSQKTLSLVLEMHDTAAKLDKFMAWAMDGKAASPLPIIESFRKINDKLSTLSVVLSFKDPSKIHSQIGKAQAHLNNIAGGLEIASKFTKSVPLLGAYIDGYLVKGLRMVEAQLYTTFNPQLRLWDQYEMEVEGRVPEMMSGRGGKEIFKFMVRVMHSSTKSMPSPNSTVKTFFDDASQEFKAGTGSTPPVDDEKAFHRWLGNNKSRAWALLYGSWKVPPLSVLDKAK